MSESDSLRKALKTSPENIALLVLYAQSCLDEWALSEARDTFEKILEFDPDNGDAKVGLARVLFLDGRTSEAAVRIEQLLQDDPHYAPAHVFLSRILLAEENSKQALKHYHEALRLDPSAADPGLEKELDFKRDATEEREVSSTFIPEPPEVSDQWIPEEDEDFDDSFSDEDAEELLGPDISMKDFERPKAHFGVVGGMEDLKEEIRMKILHPMKNPDLFRAYGKNVGGGVLLYGPPGCGKTLISKATAGEIDANFFSLGLHQILDMYIGNSEKNLHKVFQLARENAPSVLFFDEVDALAADRKDMRQTAGRNVINQFLSEMDGTDSANEGVLIIGATNAPWHIDPAFRRPGRFDRTIFMPPPDEEARVSIINVLSKDKPVVDLDARALAKKTKDFSGADLKAVFDRASELALTQAMKTQTIVPLTTRMLLKTVKEVRPTTKAWFESARNYAMYANQSGFYDDVLKFLGIAE